MRAGAPGGFAPAYDAFADSIVHAYEPARRVLTAYTGNLVRLRRASDNAEANFTYLPNGDLDVAAIATWAGGASYVVTVYDQGPFGDNVTMAVAANQPLYVASIQNGHAGMLFDGTSDYLQGAFTVGGAVNQPGGTFAVAQLDATVINNNVTAFINDGDDVVNRWFLVKSATGPLPDKWSIGAAIELQGPNAADANWKVWSALLNGAASQFWLNGVSEVAGNAGIAAIDGLTVGAPFTAAGTWWKGNITSIVIYAPSLSDAQRVAMQNAMNAYWGVY